MALFVVIEGLDGSGGTTQVERLCARLDAHRTREPTDNPIGTLIRRSLAEPALLGEGVLPYLFAADRQDHLEREIGPQLAAGRHVVSDRYYHSSLAYQSMTMPLGRVWQLNQGFRAPDLTVFLDLDVPTCLERIQARGLPLDRFEKEEALQAISASYGVVLAMLSGLGQRIVMVNAAQTRDAIEAEIWGHVQALL